MGKAGASSGTNSSLVTTSSTKTQIASPFNDALSEFVQGFGKKKKPSFVEDYLRGSVVNSDDIQTSLMGLEDRTSHKKVRTLVEPIVRAVGDYVGVLDILCQADPMPTAVVWGGLRAFIECCARYVNLYTLIRAQLAAMTNELGRLKEYEDLFGHSPAMQELLKVSYIHILRFWTKVEAQCRTPGAFLAVKSLTSFSTKKVDEIIAAIVENGNDIAKLVPIIQERLRQEDRKLAYEENRRADIVRNDLLLLKKYQEDEMGLREQERKESRKKEVRLWIRGGSRLNESNLRHQKRGEKALSSSEGADPWLLKTKDFECWFNQEGSSDGLWLKGGCGTGKSVICSQTILHVKSSAADAGVAFHYYSFDEQSLPVKIFRNVAEQLYDQLYQYEDDVSDAIYDLVKNTSDNETNLKDMIKHLASELSRTYIFIDGLDEECIDKMRWEDASDVVNFFKSIAEDDGSTLRVWCSSQVHPKIADMLIHFRKIQVDEDANSGTIEVFIANALHSLDRLDINPGTKKLVLKQLKDQARGNFLWASVMVDSVKNATSEDDIEKELATAFPDDVEKYYSRKISGVEQKHYGTISKILSCLVYAKRPLLLEELCDALGACETDRGQNINKKAILFKNKVLELCSPLVEVQEASDEGDTITTNVCSLSHSAVYAFLQKNPNILCQSTTCHRQTQEGDLSITARTLAMICLTYLSQPRYKQLLERNGKTFKTTDGQDIERHHLLTYAAKYWTIHLDDLEPSDDLCHQIAEFVKSRQFLTVLQVQSLFVEGQFTKWIKIVSIEFKRFSFGFKRIFPHWFLEHDLRCALLSRQYNEFVSEWGYFLEKYATNQGVVPGDISRCLWGSLGSENFLYQNSKKIALSKSFAFSEKVLPEDRPMEQYFDCVSETGDALQAFRLRKCDDDASQVQIVCERWKLRNNHRPEKTQSQVMAVPTGSLRLYQLPLWLPVSGRPPAISCTPDFKFAHVGSQIFSASENGKFEPLKLVDENNIYFEEIASGGRFLAIASRQNLSEKDVIHIDLDEERNDGFKNVFTEILGAVWRFAEPQNEQNISSSSGTTAARDRSSNASSRSSSSSRSSASDQGKRTAVVRVPTKADIGTDSEDSNVSIESLSARESWSEASSQPRSDEEVDLDQWNDWASDDSIEYKSVASDDLGAEADNFDDGKQNYDLQEDKFDSDGYAIASDNEGPGENIEEDYNDSSDDDGGAELEAIIRGSRQPSRGTSAHQRGKLLIYDTDSRGSTPIFRYQQLCPKLLLQGPPIFHPVAPLVIWPLGGGEILFANFKQNTYYTRTLRCSSPRSCHVSIQGRISPCGEYLHLGALEATNSTTRCLQLSFQVSTHRFSQTKTARSPPRLVFRTWVKLGSTEHLATSPLPYTLTWSDHHVYISKSQHALEVIRVPLFHSKTTSPSSGDGDADIEGTAAECHAHSNEIFLPNSAICRKVHYFPPTSHNGAKNLATVIVGSRFTPLSAESQRHVETGIIRVKRPIEALGSRYETSHPLGVFVDEEAQLGGWKVLEGWESKKPEKSDGVGGRLQGKFEKFDRTEDCDIVPYLV